MIKKNWLIFLFLFILVLIAYGNSFNNVFLSDDLTGIVQDPKIGDLGFAITTHPFNFTRPILYWLAFQLGGLTPIFFRLINIFFHTGTVFLIYILLSLLGKKRLGIFVASIFAVHPGIAEAVVWISGGMYAQYTFFFLLSLICYILSKNSKKLYLLSILFFFLSHSQMSVPLFLIFPLYEFSFGNLQKNWKKCIPFLLISIVFLLLVIIGLPGRVTTLQNVNYQQKGIDNLFQLIPIALTSYFELTFFPRILTLYHSELAFGQIQFIIRALISLIFLVGVLISFKKNKSSLPSSDGKFIFFWSSFFLISLSPTLTPFRLNWIVAERYLYMPILGLLAILGLGFDKLTSYLKFKQITYGLFILILILLSARTIMRNIDWKNEDNLWIATGKTSPSSPNTHNNLGDVYGRQGNKLAALQEFQRAIELKPNYGDAYHNLANTYMELGQIDKAIENYQNALNYNPNLWQSHQNIAAIYFQQKKYDLALENIQKAIQINQESINLRVALGIIYLNMGEETKAKEVFSLVLSFDPTNKVATQGLAEVNKP